MYDPLSSGSGFDNSSVSDTLNPQWSPPHTPKQQSLAPSDGLVVSPSPSVQSPSQSVKGRSRLRPLFLIFPPILTASFSLGMYLGPFGREPQIYGQPEPGLISPAANKASNGQSFERSEPYLRVRITGLDRNRRDILIKFDAQVDWLACLLCEFTIDLVAVD